MRRRKKKYPIVRGNRNIYVRYPIYVTVEVQQAMHLLGYIIPKVGEWIMVEALLGVGYQFIENAMPCDSREFCQKMCDIYNSHHGWKQREIKTILKKSYCYAK